MFDLAAAHDLTGRVALVSGAGSGLGRVFAQGLAAQGAVAVCADRNLGWAQETVSLLEEKGGHGHALEADVSDPESVLAMASSIAGLTSGVDVLVNNAGIATPPRATHEMPINEWDDLMGVNLRGVFLCTRAIVPLMLPRPRASIINVASILGIVGFPTGGCGYATAKAGVIGFTRQIAIEYAPRGLRVNAIAPGWHEGTRLGDQRREAANEEQRAAFEATVLQRTPLGRKGRPEELLPLLVYLASDASSYVTGQVFVHDGGWTAV